MSKSKNLDKIVRYNSPPYIPPLKEVGFTATSVSPQFRQWWTETDVSGRDDGRKEFEHPSLGYRDYDYTILRPAENQAVEVIAFIPRAA